MCTITYIPLSVDNKKFIITDNRDESIYRPAEQPRFYAEYGTQLFYPKDKKAGGTWFGVSRQHQLICLMNGAFTRHRPQKNYRKSRGVVLKELLSSAALLPALADYDFDNIEPFFALAFTWNTRVQLHELVWDGRKMHIQKKKASLPHIWSSAMTYSNTQQRQRERELKSFIESNEGQVMTPEKIWQFHHKQGEGKREGIRINRGVLKTTSISQFYKDGAHKEFFRFKDLLLGQEEKIDIRWEKATEK